MCEFFNGMPSKFKIDKSSCSIYCQNNKYKKHTDFITLLKPNLFKPLVLEQTLIQILKTLVKSKGIEKFELFQDEVKKLNKLKNSLENIIGTHSNSWKILY